MIPVKGHSTTEMQFDHSLLAGELSERPFSEFDLVLMRLSKFDQGLDRSMREMARRLLLNFEIELPKSTRVQISDLLTTGPSAKNDGRSALARDILTIVALLILKEIGHNPTKGEKQKIENRGNDSVSGAQFVFEYLVQNRPEEEIFDQVRTIEKVWQMRNEKWRKLGFSSFPD